ncbi:pyrroline-5-carboxylate reductase [Candidatus Synechococcus calcipolaris G9]|uniref:Pyrroline-5-carboxylate reductase n=2 Tax=Synechococcus TaxID=1129 RepID=A0ABT6EWT9_9SYNE|nr:pyrroline-5-carboxylate reductase [Candidatus Synechococcus calcipolaris G9]
MAEAILSRLLTQGRFHPENVSVTVRSEARGQYLHQTYGIRIAPNNAAVAIAETVLLAVKPQVYPDIWAELQGTTAQDSPGRLLSIMTGITLESLQSLFPRRAVFRIMPNTPAQVGAGMIAIATGLGASAGDLQDVQEFFQAVGDVVEVDEAQMDGVTALSGSGPAFVALFLEALADGGVAAGLPRNLARQLAYGTVTGTIALLQEKNLHPGQLKDQVASPAGTTIAGLRVLESGGVRGTIMAAVMAAKDRARELG